MKVATALRSLGNSIRGVNANLLRRATIACVLPIAYYAAETWWPGRTRPGPKSPIFNRVDNMLQALAKVGTAAARSILPVWRTTPTAALLREAGILPPELALNSITLAATTRLRKLDPRHPLRSRGERIEASGTTSRFARRVLALLQSEQVDPIKDPPWEGADRGAASNRIGTPQGRSKEEAADAFRAWAASIPSLDVVLYTDGSKLENGATGAGYVAYQGAIEITRRAIPLGIKAEVFDAEAIAALAGVEAVMTLSTVSYATNLWVCLDNLEVAIRLGASFPGTSQETFAAFNKAAEAWKHRPRAACSRLGEIRVRWVPGHTKVNGNETTDCLAKEGARMTYLGETSYTLAALRRWAKSQAPEAMEKLWKTVAPSSYKELYITTSPLKPKELLLPRYILGKILAARTGHGDFADYHERFNHENALLHCRCGARRAPLHFFFCRIAKRRIPRPLGPPSVMIPKLLGTANGAETLAKWLLQIRYFDDICPFRSLPR